MGKSVKNNPKIEKNVDPTDELLKTLIKDINLDEHELKSISELKSHLKTDRCLMDWILPPANIQG